MDHDQKQHDNLPLALRQAPLSGFNPETRSAAVVVSTGAGVRRYDWYRERSFIEVLEVSPAAINMERIAGRGMPVLNNHQTYTGLDAVLGRMTNGRIVDSDLHADVRFSKRENIAGLIADIVDNIIVDGSVGYTRDAIQMEPPHDIGGDWTYRVTRWTPMEYSFVTVPADAGAGIRNVDGALIDATGATVRTFPCEVRELPTPVPAGAAIRKDVHMDKKDENTVPAADHNAADAQRIATEATAAERRRSTDIRTAVRAAGLPDTLAEKLVSDGTAIDAARALVIDELAKKSPATPEVRGAAHIEMGDAEIMKVRAAVTSALVHRMSPGAGALDDNGAAEFRNMSMARLAEDLLERKGVKTRGMNRVQLCGRALSTSDFPNILANVANKRLRQVYEQSKPTYQIWATRAPNAPDFKTISVTQISAAPDLKLKNPGDEFKYGSASDGKETYSVLTYARGLRFTREAMINDDLNAFMRMIASFGGSASRLENKLVYLQLLTNPAMGDGNALFDATNHLNYTTPATAISVASLGVGRAAMRVQTGLQGETLNLAPKFLIVPSAMEQLAYQYTSNNFMPTASSGVNEFRTGGLTAVVPVVDGALDAMTNLAGTVVGSAARWYLAADGNQVDTVEYCYLDGYDGLYIDQEIDFDTDAVNLKGRLDFAAKVIDWRGLYLNGVA